MRGPRPHHGVTGLRLGLDRARADTALLERLEACLEPALRIDTAVEVAPALALAALVEAAERLAATDELPGPSRLWAGEEGEALATRLAVVQAALPLLPDQRRDVLPGLLDAVLEGEVVRSRRALRGRDGTEHPRCSSGTARGAAADCGRDGTGRPLRRRVAAGERTRRVAVAADARDCRAAVSGGDRRPVGA